jgi:hypothetical protein
MPEQDKKKKTVITITTETIDEPLTSTSTSTSSDTESDSDKASSSPSTCSDDEFLTREDEELSALRRETRLRLTARKRAREEEDIDEKIEKHLRDYPKEPSPFFASLADNIAPAQVKNAEDFYCEKPEFLELVNALNYAGHRATADRLHYQIAINYDPLSKNTTFDVGRGGVLHFALLYAHEQEEKRRRIHVTGRHLLNSPNIREG